MQYRVTAGLVLIKDRLGVLRHHYAGSIIEGDETDPKSVERHLGLGMIEEVDGHAPEAPAADSGDAGKTPVDDSECPAQTATTEAWVAYAIKRGLSEEEAKAATRAELIAALS